MDPNELVLRIMDMTYPRGDEAWGKLNESLENLLMWWKNEGFSPSVILPEATDVLIYNRPRTISLRYTSGKWSLQAWSMLGHDLVWSSEEK